ncbi:O-antigen ligase family protein [Thiothrix nivea]|uniref:O-antigen polymerase n=1 Tax=Thiothrix nivea (strain ATCC 35100 / DSM 5205 / JP2) TaxID=870187 RepID=A0A656HDS2_THINJ|nr:O-antigen ligase family protein [Thiothrix nivea]EIJ33185.1 O-antigen polymerase [Thiothrix nivea DSM 5205]
MNTIRNLAVVFMMLLVFAMPTDGAVEVAGMSLVKIAGLMAFGLTVVLAVMGNGLHGVAAFHTAVLLYVAWVLLSYTWSEMPVPYETTQAVSSGQALKSNLYVLMVSLLLFQLVATSGDLRKLYIALILGSFWLVYLMVKDYQVTAATVRQEIKQFDANEVAVKLAMVLPLAILLLTQARAWWSRLLALAYIPAAVFTILITGSRTGAIVMVLGLAGFLPTILRSGWLGKAASVVALMVALIGIASVVPQKTIERIFSTGKELSSGTLNERSVIWAKAYEEWEESPLYGHGLGSFRRIINPYNVDYTAHNSFVAVTAEQGMVGTLLYLAVICISAVSAWRLRGDDRWLMALMLLIVLIGQMSLTLQDRMYVWLAYGLIVLNTYIKNNAPSAEYTK